MNNDTQDKLEGNLDEAKGRGKQAWGDVADDDQAQTEGQTDEAKGRGKQALGDAKDTAGDLKDKVSDSCN